MQDVGRGMWVSRCGFQDADLATQDVQRRFQAVGFRQHKTRPKTSSADLAGQALRIWF